MRKIAAAILAVPVLVAVYLPVLRRPGVAIRAVLAVGAGLLIVVAALGTLPRTASALPPATSGPVAPERFGPNVESRDALGGPVTFNFPTPMDEASVAAAINVNPQMSVTLAWLDGGRTLLVSPQGAWAPATYYTITIRASARDAAGVALAGPLQTAFYTRGPTGARIVATAPLANGRVAPDTAFIVAFDRPVDVAAARAAFRIEPPVAGDLQGDVAVGPTEKLTFLPTDGLASGTQYTISIAGRLLDTDGSPVAAIQPLVVETVVTPTVVRFRPRAGTEDVDPGVDISVRFTRPMNKAVTQRAFVVTAGGAPLAGDYLWAENDTVLVFNPRDPLPWGTTIVMSVTAAAAGADGSPIEAPVTAHFATVPQPAATAAATPRATPTPAPTPKATPGAVTPKVTPSRLPPRPRRPPRSPPRSPPRRPPAPAAPAAAGRGRRRSATTSAC